MGANLGCPVRQLRWACRILAKCRGVGLLGASRAYATPSQPPGRPRYLNAVVAVRTGLPPQALLRRLLRLEAARRRARGRRNASRTLDLDLLCCGGARRAGRRLRLPHPRVGERAFVLTPMADVAPRAAGRLAADAALLRRPYPRRGGRLPVRPLGDTMRRLA